MTEPREVTVSDEEISAIYKFCDEMDAREDAPAPREIFRQALAAFLAARVPDAINPETERHKADGFTPREVSLVCLVHNACCDKVLKGV